MRWKGQTGRHQRLSHPVADKVRHIALRGDLHRQRRGHSHPGRDLGGEQRRHLQPGHQGSQTGAGTDATSAFTLTVLSPSAPTALLSLVIGAEAKAVTAQDDPSMSAKAFPSIDTAVGLVRLGSWPTAAGALHFSFMPLGKFCAAVGPERIKWNSFTIRLG